MPIDCGALIYSRNVTRFVIRSPFDGHLGCFQVVVIINKSCCEHLSFFFFVVWWTYTLLFSLEMQFHKEWNCGVKNPELVLGFISNSERFVKVAAVSPPPPGACSSPRCPGFPSALFTASLLNSSHWSGCVVKYHCGFILHFPAHIMYLGTFIYLPL